MLDSYEKLSARLDRVKTVANRMFESESRVWYGKRLLDVKKLFQHYLNDQMFEQFITITESREIISQSDGLDLNDNKTCVDSDYAGIFNSEGVPCSIQDITSGFVDHLKSTLDDTYESEWKYPTTIFYNLMCNRNVCLDCGLLDNETNVDDHNCRAED